MHFLKATFLLQKYQRARDYYPSHKNISFVMTVSLTDFGRWSMPDLNSRCVSSRKTRRIGVVDSTTRASRPPLRVILRLNTCPATPHQKATAISKDFTRWRLGRAMGTATFLEVLLAILLPPVGVFLRYGCGVTH